MSRYINMCQEYCHINNNGVKTYLTLAHFKTAVRGSYTNAAYVQ